MGSVNGGPTLIFHKIVVHGTRFENGTKGATKRTPAHNNNNIPPPAIVSIWRNEYEPAWRCESDAGLIGSKV